MMSSTNMFSKMIYQLPAIQLINTQIIWRIVSREEFLWHEALQDCTGQNE